MCDLSSDEVSDGKTMAVKQLVRIVETASTKQTSNTNTNTTAESISNLKLLLIDTLQEIRITFTCLNMYWMSMK